MCFLYILVCLDLSVETRSIVTNGFHQCNWRINWHDTTLGKSIMPEIQLIKPGFVWGVRCQDNALPNPPPR